MKRHRLILLPVIGIALLGLFFYQLSRKTNRPVVHHSASPYQRIISLSPNITEMLFALGLGNKVVGVTRFCNYPAEAQLKPRVGGYLDPNYEAILRLKPDVVILISEFQQIKDFLSELGVEYLTVDNKTVADIRSSLEYLGAILGAKPRAEKILNEIDAKISAIQQQTSAARRPKVMIVIERTMGTGAIEDVYVAGKGTFYDELIHLAGGTNAYQDEKIAYSILSAEGIIHLNPEIIIDLIPQLQQIGLDSARLENDWASLGQVDAVKKRQVHIVSQDYAVIPGPRFILFLDDLYRLIHPEMNGGNH